MVKGENLRNKENNKKRRKIKFFLKVCLIVIHHWNLMDTESSFYFDPLSTTHCQNRKQQYYCVRYYKSISLTFKRNFIQVASQSTNNLHCELFFIIKNSKSFSLIDQRKMFVLMCVIFSNIFAARTIRNATPIIRFDFKLSILHYAVHLSFQYYACLHNSVY